MVHKRPKPEGQPWVRLVVHGHKSLSTLVYVRILHSDLVWSSMVWCSYHFWYAQCKKWNHTCLGMKFIPLFSLCIAQVAYRKLQIAVVYEQNLQLSVSTWKYYPPVRSTWWSGEYICNSTHYCGTHSHYIMNASIILSTVTLHLHFSIYSASLHSLVII